MFCVKCGTKIEDGVKFCSGCGTPVVSAGVEIEQERAVNYSQTQPSALPASDIYQAQNTQAAAPETADKKATAALILGIGSLVAWLIPLLGFPVSIVGIIMGATGIGNSSAKKTWALTGLILSIIGFVASIISSIIGATLGTTGQLFY
jgi:hypothetical protein